MPKKRSGKKKKSGNRKSGLGKAFRDLGIKSVEVYAPNSRRKILNHAVCTGAALAYKTDSSGGISGTSTPTNGTNQLSFGLFTIANTMLADCDEVQVHAWILQIVPVSNNQGGSLFWFDWDDAGNVTAAEAQNKNPKLLSNSNTSATAYPVSMVGRPPKGPPYTNVFNPNGTFPYTASFKWYTDANTYGSGDSVFEFTITPHVVFDGYAYA